MTPEQLIAKIKEEKAKVGNDIASNQGLLRLQEVAAAYDGEYRLVWSDTLLEAIKARPQRAMHKMGIPMLDDLLGGLREQMMVGVAAHSGHGKTAMGLFMMQKYESLNPVMIPLEQSNEELIEQRLANGQFVPRFLSPEKHAARVRPDWLEMRIVEAIAKYDSRLIVIDHLGYVDCDAKYDRDPEPLRIERKLQDIKNLAKKWNVIILVLIHITQLEEGTPPSLVNLKGSSAIRQECDKIIMLWRKNAMKNKVRVYENETLFSLQKNRWSGRNGNVGLTFDPETGNYEVNNSWVKSMEDMANLAINADDSF